MLTEWSTGLSSSSCPLSDSRPCTLSGDTVWLVAVFDASSLGRAVDCRTEVSDCCALFPDTEPGVGPEFSALTSLSCEGVWFSWELALSGMFVLVWSSEAPRRWCTMSEPCAKSSEAERVCHTTAPAACWRRWFRSVPIICCTVSAVIMGPVNDTSAGILLGEDASRSSIGRRGRWWLSALER